MDERSQTSYPLNPLAELLSIGAEVRFTAMIIWRGPVGQSSSMLPTGLSYPLKKPYYY
jgi:hypothetical protein